MTEWYKSNKNDELKKKYDKTEFKKDNKNNNKCTDEEKKQLVRNKVKIQRLLKKRNASNGIRTRVIHCYMN